MFSGVTVLAVVSWRGWRAPCGDDGTCF